MADTETHQILRQWLPRAVSGEPHAVGMVVGSVHPHVVDYCAARMDRHTRAHTPVEDVAQEVCLALMRALPRFRDRGGSLLRFTFGIAAHKVADARRAAGRRGPTPVRAVPESGPEETVLDDELRLSVRELVDRLPEGQRHVLQLRIVQGLSAERTAELLGTTAGAVRVAQHRALQRIRLQLNESGHG
ncbi:RNA polymerase sigma factor ShbA [Rhodococcus sp. NPDC003318]|uniref:RNA polymerase sigma factor ShbA n=1 Tax=Rhodococcus sp. NPDC003318 TaxID=3364503 RepID=UPI0036C4366C